MQIVDPRSRISFSSKIILTTHDLVKITREIICRYISELKKKLNHVLLIRGREASQNNVYSVNVKYYFFHL